MGRLIDVEIFKNQLINEPWTDYSKEAVIRMIDAQPTAYDVDKVVERLEKLIINNKSVNKTECENMECLSTDCIECMTLHAIEIVREGDVKDE
jgi:competence protein ComGC